MTDQTAISFVGFSARSEGVVVVFAEEGPLLTPAAKDFDEASQGVLSKAAKIAGFKGKKKSAVDLLAPANLDCARLILVGLEKAAGYSAKDWINLGGTVRGMLSGKEAPVAHVFLQTAGEEVSAEDAARFALGASLRGYSFKKYKTAKKDDDKAAEKALKKLVIHCADPRAAQRAYTAEGAVAEGVMLARDLVNEPANVLTPTEFAERAKALAPLGVEVEVLNEQRLKKLGMNALLGVGQGSSQPSFVVVMQWKGAGEKGGAPVAFVGKGVCFDTGGISIKPSAGMEDMKGDMGGAACVVGLMHELAARKAKVNAVGVIGLVENMPDGNAQRPGDIIAAMSGTTVEVINTDAEGRLVLADCLWYTQDRFKPKAMVNLATLTGAVMVALGKEHAGLFSNNDALAEEITAAGLATGEKVWRLPLGPKYDKLIESKTADIKNIGGRFGGAITAAQFLQRFVKPDSVWAHLDIAGTAMASADSDINRSWGSGFGVRLLDQLVRENYEK